MNEDIKNPNADDCGPRLNDNQIDTYCLEWVRWCETRKFYLRPAAQDMYASIKAGGGGGMNRAWTIRLEAAMPRARNPGCRAGGRQSALQRSDVAASHRLRALKRIEKVKGIRNAADKMDHFAAWDRWAAFENLCSHRDSCASDFRFGPYGFGTNEVFPVGRKGSSPHCVFVKHHRSRSYKWEILARRISLKDMRCQSATSKGKHD